MRKDNSKVHYSAWLTQSGENPPLADVMIEKILRTFWSRIAPGIYTFKHPERFDFYFDGLPEYSATDILPNGDKITITLTFKNEVTLKTFAAGNLNTPVDGILNDYCFEFIIPKK
jgi:hypothetical protein